MSDKEYRLDFSDMSGGLNSSDPPHALEKNQVQKTLNLIHEKNGVSRAPGYIGYDPTLTIGRTGKNIGFIKYIKEDGTVLLITISSSLGRIYYVNLETGIRTFIAYTSSYVDKYYNYVNAVGKLFFCNGVNFFVLNSELQCSNVQIPAITSPNFYIRSGGNCPAGTYSIYVCNAYEDTEGKWLYSYPTFVATETVVDNTEFRVQIQRPYQTRNNRVVVFMTDTDGSVPYSVYERSYDPDDPMTLETIDFDLTYIDTTKTMAALAADNQELPIVPDNIFYFDNRIFVWKSGTKTVYWSLASDVNALDLERFVPENFRTLPFVVSSMFSIGTDLYFNHVGIGVTVAYNGDMSSVIKHVQKQFWFMPCRSGEGSKYVSYIKGIVFGLTNDGFRFFDGRSFSNDISFNIKPNVDKIYLNADVIPTSCVYRRPGKRTEYRLSFSNIDYNPVQNNDQLIFNIDNYFSEYPKLTWENWEGGFDSQLIIDNKWYGSQYNVENNLNIVVKEHGSEDIRFCGRNNAYIADSVQKKAYLMTRTVIEELDSISFWGPVYGLAVASGELNGNIIVFDRSNKKFPFTLYNSATSDAILPSSASGLGLALPFVMAPTTPKSTVVPMGWDCRGNSIAIEISQIQNDTEFFIYKIELPRIRKERNNLT